MDTENLFNKLAVTEIKTQSDYLADKIRDMIVSRDLVDNFKFPNELEFSKKLNVSRATLREAYKVLATQGFIHIAKHGTYVKGRQDIAKQGAFIASLDLAGKREMLEFVCSLEPQAVYLAVEKVNAAELKTLEKLLIACEAVADNSKELMEKNYEFHSYIRDLAKNYPITSALAAYYDIFNQQIIGNIYSSNVDIEEFRANSLRQHRDLFEAFKNKDAKCARKITYQHLIDDIEGHEIRFQNGKM
ncbi:MAG: FadR/GntR family transcriptional regulator [Suipraeoptans sp.]